MEVLLVDDEPALLDLTKMFLEKEGICQVTTASSAAEAMGAISQRDFDIIVSDYEMPKMDGLEFLRALRRGGDETPFIIFTGRGREDVAISALNEGADFYVQKGGDPRSQFGELLSYMDYAVANRRAQRRLEDNETRLRLITSNINDVVLETDLEGVIDYISPSHQRILGRGEEVLGESIFRHVHPDDVERAEGRFRWLLSTPDEGLMEYRYLRPDGREIWIESSVSTYTDNQGRRMALISSRDTTERKNACDELEASKNFLEGIFDGIRDGISILDRDMNVISTNYWMEMMYPDMVPLVGKKCYQVYARKDHVCPWCPVVESFRTGGRHTATVPWPSEDDPQGWLELTSHPMLDEDGEVEYIIEHVRDTRQQETAVTQAQEREDMLEFIVSKVPAVLYVYDIASGSPLVTYVSSNVKELLGVEPEELMGEVEGGLFESFVHPQDLGLIRETYNLRSTECDYRIMKSDGSYALVRDHQQAYLASDGRQYVIGLVWEPESQADHGQA